jgi:hypothetical protein
MITESEYNKLRAKIDHLESWRNTPQSAALSLLNRPLFKVTNEERSAVEVYEFVHDIPERYFAYVKLHDQELLGNAQLAHNRYGNLTTWTGDTLGGIYWMGREFRSNMGDKRIPIRVRGINGRSYSGTYYKSAGDYARLRLLK